jgi:glycolate oxidase iron-sulfur subunit
MQTVFTPERLADPQLASSEKILRSCVHCGFCTATCPTYVLLGDELDSPRGRIYQIKDMFENNRPATKEVVKHIDRCLSCLSCMSTCPSGVHYQHLIDHAREHVELTYTRPFADRALRALLGKLLPSPTLFRLSLLASYFAKPLKPLFSGRMRAMLDLAPKTLPTKSPFANQSVFPVAGSKGRVIVTRGCVQSVLAPHINEAAVRVLNRAGYEVVMRADEGCCGSLNHHIGKVETSHTQAKRLIDQWMLEIDLGLDAILITASGCGTTIKDYGFMFKDDAEYAARAALVSSKAKDISEFITGLELVNVTGEKPVVTYHSACSMQHGQQLKEGPKLILKRLGLTVKEPQEGHICCGSAGVYNILQPEIAAQLRERKVNNLLKTAPEIIVTGNIGCMTQIGFGLDIKGKVLPVLHTIEVVDWLTGGTKPDVIPK